MQSSLEEGSVTFLNIERIFQKNPNNCDFEIQNKNYFCSQYKKYNILADSISILRLLRLSDIVNINRFHNCYFAFQLFY